MNPSTHRRQMLRLLPGLLIASLVAAQPNPAQPKDSRMWMTIGEHRFSITLADTQAARQFVAMLPLSIDMADLNGNEKHAELPKSLPTNPHRPGTIRHGDLMLYGSRTLVVFYLTFHSSYAYTSLGRIDEPAPLASILGQESRLVHFSRH